MTRGRGRTDQAPLVTAGRSLQRTLMSPSRWLLGRSRVRTRSAASAAPAHALPGSWSLMGSSRQLLNSTRRGGPRKAAPSENVLPQMLMGRDREVGRRERRKTTKASGLPRAGLASGRASAVQVPGRRVGATNLPQAPHVNNLGHNRSAFQSGSPQAGPTETRLLPPMSH